MRSGFLGRGIGPSAFGGGGQTASWQVTTTGAETLTIAAFTVSAATVVDWGDGSSDTYSGAGARTHDYAGAGTWTVRVMQPLNVTALTLSDNKVTLNSADIASMSNMTMFNVNSLKSGTFNSADVSAWRPTNFYLFSMPAGYAGTFDSADVSAWRPTNFNLSSMPAGYALTAGGGFANWTKTTSCQVQANALAQATVDAILWELYQASAAPRTATGGTINISGTNAAPSGTFQACASPPVSAATPGKEIAYELLNDSLGLFNNWATVTITA